MRYNNGLLLSLINVSYITTLLQYSQVNYYSQVEACAAEYSTILEQVGEMTIY